MSDDDIDLSLNDQPADEAPGWQVLDPDGNVVDSGSVVQLEAVTETGEGQEQQ